MHMVTFGPVEASPDALEKAVAQARSEFRERLDLGVIYLPIEANHERLLDLAQVHSGVRFVGATTGGASFTERGWCRNGVTGALLGGNHAALQHVVVHGLRDRLNSRVAEGVARLFPGALSGHSLFVLADAMACEGEQLTSVLRQCCPLRWKFFGGTAGDDWKFRTSYVFAEGRRLQDAAVLVYINSHDAPQLRVRHGFCAAPSALPLKVTATDGPALVSLDDQPAAEVYQRELERLGLLRESGSLAQQLALHSLGLETPYGERLKMRTPIGLRGDGAIVLASSVPVGATVWVVTADLDKLIDAARQSAQDALVRLLRPPLAELVIDCAARLQLLGDRYPEQLAAFGVGGNHPVLGFASYGEIAVFGGAPAGFHNTTAVLAVW